MAGKAIIFSAPSGSGKTTIVKHLSKNNPDLGFSISASTRDRRGRKEEDGKDYYFLTPEQFKKKIDEDAFIEWEEVYEGNFYGTLKSEIESIWNEGKNVIFDVDVKGGLNLKKYFGDKALAIFVKVPSEETLKARLHDRGTETPEQLSRRLFKAKFEMTFQDDFDRVLLNENLEDALAEAQRLYDMFTGKENSSVADQICHALKNKQRVEFVYNDKKRIGEPQSCGVSTAGNEVARFYLVEGGGRPEQLFTVSEMKSFKILNDHFTKPGPNYQKDDSAMKHIYCQL